MVQGDIVLFVRTHPGLTWKQLYKTARNNGDGVTERELRQSLYRGKRQRWLYLDKQKRWYSHCVSPTEQTTPHLKQIRPLPPVDEDSSEQKNVCNNQRCVLCNETDSDKAMYTTDESAEERELQHRQPTNESSDSDAKDPGSHFEETDDGDVSVPKQRSPRNQKLVCLECQSCTQQLELVHRSLTRALRAVERAQKHLPKHTVAQRRRPSTPATTFVPRQRERRSY